MSESLTENMVTEDTWMKNGGQKGSKMELFLTSVYVLCLGTCMFVEIATSDKENGTIGVILGNKGAK